MMRRMLRTAYRIPFMHCIRVKGNATVIITGSQDKAHIVTLPQCPLILVTQFEKCKRRKILTSVRHTAIDIGNESKF